MLESKAMLRQPARQHSRHTAAGYIQLHVRVKLPKPTVAPGVAVWVAVWLQSLQLRVHTGCLLCCYSQGYSLAKTWAKT